MFISVDEVIFAVTVNMFALQLLINNLCHLYSFLQAGGRIWTKEMVITTDLFYPSD